MTLDLGRAREIDAVRLYPARPYDWQPDTPGFLFPVRFKVEAGQAARLLGCEGRGGPDGANAPNPGVNVAVYRFPTVRARYVRLIATRLARRSSNDYGLALAEMLNDDGTIYTANLRGAAKINEYTLRGGGEEAFEPHFTCHGFRYVELAGLPAKPAADAVLGRVFHSSSPDVGE